MATINVTNTNNAPDSRSAVVALWLAVYKHLWTVLPLVILVRFLLRRYLSPLTSYPGPLLASGSRMWKGS